MTAFGLYRSWLLPSLLSLCLPLGYLSAQPSAESSGPTAADSTSVTASTFHVHDLSFARRVVRHFDFEERAEGIFETMPRYWRRDEGPGLPRYTEIGLDSASPHGGRNGLRLALNGGSAAVQLDQGVIGVVPEGRYAVSLFLRTFDTVVSRPVVEGWYIDAAGQPIESTRTQIILPPTDGQWRQAILRMPDAPLAAGWLVLRLGLLQPERIAAFRPLAAEIARQDLRAEVWFDDVTVSQLPRIRLQPADPTGVVLTPDPVEYDVAIHDLTGQNLVAHLRTFDQHGRLCDELIRPLEVGRPGQWKWRPKLPGPGWYITHLEVVAADGSAVAGAASDAVTLLDPPDASAPDQGRFLLLAHDHPPAELPLVVRLLDRTGRHAVLLHAPADGIDLATEDLLRRLTADRRRIALAITDIPAAAAATLGLDAHDPLALFSLGPVEAGPHLDPLIARYGAYVTDWVLGDPLSVYVSPRSDAPVRFDEADRFISRLVVGRRVYLPWSAQVSWPAAAPASLSAGDGRSLLVDAPDSIRPDQFRDYIEPLAEPAQIALVLRTLSADRYSHDDRAADLALRMIHAWDLGVGTLALPRPWAAVDPDSPRLTPDSLLPVWVNVSRFLADRRVVGRFEPSPGVTALILHGDRGDALAVWRSGPDGDGTMTVDEAADARVTDVWGRTRPLDGPTLSVGPSPLFLEGPDLRLMRFRAAFTVDPGSLRSVFARHEAHLTLFNPWPTTINGRIRMTGPERWEIEPALTTFTIPPGETHRLPISMSFPINEPAGAKRLTARVEVEADETHEFDVWAPIEVGLPDLEMETKLSVEGADLIVTLRLTNHGKEERSFHVFALPPGMERQQRIIPALAPGQTTVKTFVIEGAAGPLSGQSLRAGIRQIDGPEILNHLLAVP